MVGIDMVYEVVIVLVASCAMSALAADSCTGRCGTFDLNNYDCQCNYDCVKHGNCCPDYNVHCDTQATCVGRNCYGDDHSLPCQCNSYCSHYSDCCPDYQAICIGSCEGRCGPGTDASKNCQCNSYCEQYGDCCDDYHEQCLGSTSGPTCIKGSVSDADLSSISFELWTLSENNAAESDIVYNIQSSTTNSANDDVAPQPFFTFVNEGLLQTDMYQKLQALQDNYIRTQGYTEVVTDDEIKEEDEFLDAVLATAVGQRLFDFLSGKGLAGCEGIDGFKTILKDIWFGMYDRQATHDTSGFEHAFVGEIKGSGVSGFHNWVNFYREEQKGNFNYQGYLSELEPRIVGMRHTWYGATKPINGFTIGTSPEIELALFTLCHLARPNKVCNIKLANEFGNPLARQIQTYTWTKSYPPSGQSYVASAYFIS